MKRRGAARPVAPQKQRWPVFWLEPVAQGQVSLRRFRSSGKEGGSCDKSGMGYHNAERVIIDAYAATFHVDESRETRREVIDAYPDVPHDDPRWPAQCACGYTFTEDDYWQTNTEQLHRSSLDGGLYTLKSAPIGAMWDADWMGEMFRGPDGICLIVKLPDGSDWPVDMEASNCTRSQWQPVPGEQNTRRWTGRTHYCWVRHGDPRTAPSALHVDKGAKGESCNAGGGSIQSGVWHGFLSHGYLQTER